jgi:hypothetical protein
MYLSPNAGIHRVAQISVVSTFHAPPSIEWWQASIVTSHDYPNAPNTYSAIVFAAR